MLGEITSIGDNTISVKLNIEKDKRSGIVNNHLIFTYNNDIIVGEVITIDNDCANVLLVGEINNNTFIPGTIKKPDLTSSIRLINDEELKLLIGIENNKSEEYFYLGKTNIYNNYPIYVKYNDFFSNHFSIFGNSGSGKSCSIARIIQNVFSKINPIAYKSNMIIFDVYGEYNTAFKDINKTYPNISSKIYTTDLNSSEHKLINIPFHLLGLDDIALLLDATEPSQLPILKKALLLANIFNKVEEESIKYKNDIIARTIQQILYSGKSGSQIRDQILAILSTYNTTELNAETKISQPGYIRTFKQCLIVDSNGKINEMQLVGDFINQFIDDNLDYNTNIINKSYSIQDFEMALEFALISEGVLKSDKIYDLTNLLRVRLNSISTSTSSKFFECDNYISKEEYIRGLLTNFDGKKAQILNFNMNYVDDRFAKVLVKIYSKMFFDYCTSLKNRATFPFHIVVEEAHRYIQNDNDTYLLGYNIFDRIAKEGRKYGVILGLISQRPSELSETAISQCTNFLVLRMLHPKDLEYVEDMIPDITSEITKKLKTLQKGCAIGFGSSFRIPVLIKFDLPNPMPQSTNCDIMSSWFVNLNK